MNRPQTKYLFLSMAGLLGLLLFFWVLYSMSSIKYADEHPEVMNEWIVFAFLGMFIYLVYHLIFLGWSAGLHWSGKKPNRNTTIQFVLITLFGFIPSLLLLIKSAVEAIHEFKLAYL